MDPDNLGIGLWKAWISTLCKNLWIGCAICGFAHQVHRVWILIVLCKAWILLLIDLHSPWIAWVQSMDCAGQSVDCAGSSVDYAGPSLDCVSLSTSRLKRPIRGLTCKYYTHRKRLAFTLNVLVPGQHSFHSDIGNGKGPPIAEISFISIRQPRPSWLGFF